jgi:hypothetical protein
MEYQDPTRMAREIWDALPKGAKDVINNLCNKQSRRQVKTHTLTSDIDEMDPDNDDNTPDDTHQEQEDAHFDNPLLDYLWGDSESFHYGDIQEILAANSQKPPFRHKPFQKEGHSPHDTNQLSMNTHKVQYQVKMAEKTTYQVTFNVRFLTSPGG